MLPVFTTGQVKDGIDIGDLMINLDDYMKKKEGATKTELDTLTAIVANKLDAEPQHKHHIEDIKQLETALASKYDTSEKYSYSVILSDSEKIPYLEAPKVGVIELAKDRESTGYKFYVDDSSSDLMIVSDDDVLIGTYVKATGNWILGGVNLSEISSGIGSISELTSRVQENSIDIAAESVKITALSRCNLISITGIRIHHSVLLA